MKLLIFDGNSILNRAFYAIKMLTTSSGQHTNAVYGFLNIYFKFIEEQKPDYICVAFDLPAPTFRHEMFEGYKIKRKQMPQELAEQMGLIKEVLDALNVKYITKAGYEADDIIGTVSKKCNEADVECMIVTGDKDDLQLVCDNTKVLFVSTRMGQTTTTTYNKDEVFNLYGLTPAQLLDLKALMGDASDNIPGVAGIGEKTALSLMQKYKSLDIIYDEIDTLEEKETLKNKLKAGHDMAYLSRKLGEIDCGVPIDFNIDDFLIKQDFDKNAYEIFNKLEFKTLIAKLELKPDLVKQIIPDIKPADENIIKSISDECVFKYILLKDDIIFFANGEIYRASVLEIKKFKDVFENLNIKKITYDIKKDIVMLNAQGISLDGLGFDFLLASYVCDPSLVQGGFSTTIKRFLDKDDALFDMVSQNKEGAALCISVMDELREALDKKIKENQQEYLYYDIELYLANVLAQMEIQGIYVDKNTLGEIGKSIAQEILELENEICFFAGEKFNIGSPKQLGVILFEKLKLPTVKKTKTGYSTDAEVLEKLLPYNPIIEKILRYRQLTKLNSTYVEGLMAVINNQTGKIHTSFNQALTMTGRLSSIEPNLQNIPIRLELGRQIRKAFKCKSEDYIFITADYSQIELRILAHISGDENMILAYKENKDIHTVTASEVFSVPIEMVTPLMRSRAKAVNFGIVYGISDFSLSNDIGVSTKEAKTYKEGYFRLYNGVREYMDKIVETAKHDGFVKTLFNRIRYIPELKNSNHNIRSFGERVALNTPIQGTAADIIKIAMVNVHKKILELGLKSKLILQVHDELIIESSMEEADLVEKIIKEEMENAIELKVPLTVSVSRGKTWYDAK